MTGEKVQLASQPGGAVGATASAVPLPMAIEELDLEWLGKVLPNGALAQVLASRVDRVIWGTATKALLTVDIRDADGTRRSEAICVKGPFDESLRNYYDLGVMFVIEAAFYRDVAPGLNIPLPKCFYASEDGKYGVVILENMTARGCTFAHPKYAMSVDQAAIVLDILAELHGRTWGWRTDRFPWLQLGSPSGRVGVSAMGEGDRYDALCARPEVSQFLPADYRDRDRTMAALRRLWSNDDKRSELSLGHGDPHIGQVYFEPGGAPGLLDWQSVGMMPGMKDVAYFLGGAVSVADRRAHERDLLAGYLSTLHDSGGPRLSVNDIWDDYRAQMLQGIVWALVTEQMQPIEAIAALNERYLTAMRDLGSLEAVE